MPFTFSHPAIVLPLILFPKRFFSITALVIGSMIPDFEYFIRMKLQSKYSHTLGGIFWLDLPLTILVAFIFHNIVRNHLIDNLPYFLKARFFIFKSFDWNKYFIENWLVVVASALIGAFSHLFWDSFTHHDGYFVNNFPVLESTVVLFNTELPILKILQHSSTFLGGILILLVLLRMPKFPTDKKRIDVRYWLLIILFSFLITMLKIFIAGDSKFGNVLVTYIAALFLSFIFCSLFLSKKADEIL